MRRFDRGAGGVLTVLLLVLYAAEFCATWIILGIFSYFLARLADNSLRISGDWIAVEAISGVTAVLWTPAAFVATLFFGSSAVFAISAVTVNLLLCACFVGLAILTRDGSNSCTAGNVHTPLGYGPANSENPAYGRNGFGFGAKSSKDYAPDLHLACVLNRICFILSIITAFFLLANAALHFLALRSSTTSYWRPHRISSTASSSRRRKRPRPAPLPSRNTTIISEKQPQTPLPARTPRPADEPIKFRTTLRDSRPPPPQSRLSARQVHSATGAPQLPELRDLSARGGQAPMPATEVPGSPPPVHELEGEGNGNGADNLTDNASSHYQGTMSDDTASNPYLSYRAGV